MHLADPFVSIPVGLCFWGLASLMILKVCRSLEKDPDDSRIPFTGVMAAFVLAAQMVNIAIPVTGASGHLTGGILLAYLLGTRRAFLALTSVLVIQCLFLADGGLLAFGCNLFNLAILPVFVAFPLVRGWTNFAGEPAPEAVVVGGLVSLLLGSLSLWLQIVLSGRSAAPATTLLAFLVPIHLLIGLVEGVATWAIIGFLRKARPGAVRVQPLGGAWIPAAAILTTTILLVALAPLGSKLPDGLEWSLENTGAPSLAGSSTTWLGNLPPTLDSMLPESPSSDSADPSARESLPGLMGSGLALALAWGLGVAVRRRSRQGSLKPS